MKTFHKTVLTIFSAIGLSYVFLFILGSLSEIVAYNDLSNLPQLKLTLFQTILFLTMTLSNFYILQNLMSRNRYSLKALFFIGLIDIVLVWHFASIGTYISIGDMLRDTHGINWYTMDYAGFAVTMSFFLISTIGAVLFFVTSRIFNKRLHK